MKIGVTRLFVVHFLVHNHTIYPDLYTYTGRCMYVNMNVYQQIVTGINRVCV